MKKFIISSFFCAGMLISAQQKSPLSEAKFWEGAPSLKEVKKEVRKGFDFKNTEGASDPIFAAIMAKASPEVIKYLTDQKGVDIEKKFFHERTYLHWATNAKLYEVVKHLIKKGANLNALDDKGANPLVYACRGGNITPEILELYIKNGFDISQKYPQLEGADLLLLCIGQDKGLKITDELISKGLSLQVEDKKGRGAFYYAALVGDNVENLRTLVKRGVKYDSSALLAVAEGAHKVTNGVQPYLYLIGELKLDPKITNVQGETLLHIVARKPKQEEVINYLLSSGADASRKDKNGNTAFMLVCGGKSLSIVKQLFPYCRDINAKNANGETALLNAVKTGSTEIVNFLLQKGASLRTTDAKGNSLAFVLVDSFRVPKKGRQADKDFLPKLLLLQEKGLNFAQPFRDGSTVYHIAAAKNNLDFIRSLSPIKADINAKNNDGLTALHKAALVAKDDQILKYLISLGADKKIKTDLDETAYDIAKDNEALAHQNIDLSFLK